MKNLISFLVLILFCLNSCAAQKEKPTTPTPPSPPMTETSSSTSSSTSSNTTINFSNGKNEKLNLKVNDTNFDLDLDFKKINTQSVRKLITKYLGTPQKVSKGKEEWSDEGKTYRIRLGKGNFEAEINKEEFSEADYQKFLSFASDVLDELGWEINLDKY